MRTAVCAMTLRLGVCGKTLGLASCSWKDSEIMWITLGLVVYGKTLGLAVCGMTEISCLCNDFQMDLAKAINDSFCGNAANMGIRARYPFQTDANFTTRDFLATSLRTVAVLNKTVALIGTTSGHLLKVSTV